MSTPKPLISIVTPVLNGMPYLAACIESVLTQGYPNIEHVVIDGGSTDGSVELLRSYSARFPSRVRFVSEPDNGPGDGWSKGVRMTRGGVLGCIGADDRLEIEVHDRGLKRYESSGSIAGIDLKLRGLAPLRGMGLMMIAQLVDEAGFTESVDGGNHFRLVLYFRKI